MIRILIISTFTSLQISFIANARQLRGVFSAPDADYRSLEWIWAPEHKVVNDNVFYGHRTEKSYNDNRSNPGTADREDFLRDTDLCFDAFGALSRNNCPKPPNCHWSAENNGPAKLCINRAPMPDNHNLYYVLLMKCIPKFVNCDKCYCGAINSDTATSTSAQCIYRDQNPSDDQTYIRCNDLRTVKMTSIQTGEKFSFSPPSNAALNPSNGSNSRNRRRRRKKNKPNRQKSKNTRSS